MVYIQNTTVYVYITDNLLPSRACHTEKNYNYHFQATGCISNLKKRFADAQRIYAIPFTHFTKTAVTLLNSAK